MLCHATVQVLWAEHDGLRSDVRFKIVLAPGIDGYLRIRSIKEERLILRSDLEAFTEDTSWGGVKNLYRSTPPYP